MTNNIKLDFYLEPPELTENRTLEIAALAPLSMVDSLPGTYFRSANKPSEQMVYGLLENALGWHFGDKFRREVLKELGKAAKKIHRKNEIYKDHPWLSGRADSNSGSGYFSLLQYHLAVGEVSQPAYLSYDDLWSMHLHDRGMNFVGGSRNYDYRLERFITQLRTKVGKDESKWEVGDRKGFEKIELEEVYDTLIKQVHTQSIRDGFPEHYVSPKKRGFVEPAVPYRCQLKMTAGLANLFDTDLSKDNAPTYLGSSEGWVHINLINHAG